MIEFHCLFNQKGPNVKSSKFQSGGCSENIFVQADLCSGDLICGSPASVSPMIQTTSVELVVLIFATPLWGNY